MGHATVVPDEVRASFSRVWLKPSVLTLFPYCHVHTAPLPVNDHATSSATAMTTIAMYPNNDTLGERLRLYAEENFHDA
jgi:hypothetical protein